MQPSWSSTSLEAALSHITIHRGDEDLEGMRLQSRKFTPVGMGVGYVFVFRPHQGHIRLRHQSEEPVGLCPNELISLTRAAQGNGNLQKKKRRVLEARTRTRQQPVPRTGQSWQSNLRGILAKAKRENRILCHGVGR